MLPDADFEQNSTAFLKRFVKPADSAKARRELPLLKQEGRLVETYAAKFNNMNNRITEGTAIDSTTLAVYFQQGLSRRISSALVNSQSIATMQNLALVMTAAEEMESKLELSVKQAQVEVPAPGNPNTNKRGRFNNRGGGNANPSFHNISTNNRGGGRGPFNAGQGNVARGRGTRVRGGGRGWGPPPGHTSQAVRQPVYDAHAHCVTCNAIGHSEWLCPTVNREVKPASASYAEYAVAAITDMPLPGPPNLAHQYAHQCVSNCDDSYAALHSIGATSIPLGVMPDPADVNPDPAATSGAINVLSPHGLTMMFQGMVSVKEGLLPVRTLADTGASHCYVSQAYVKKVASRAAHKSALADCHHYFTQMLTKVQRSMRKGDTHPAYKVVTDHGLIEPRTFSWLVKPLSTLGLCAKSSILDVHRTIS